LAFPASDQKISAAETALGFSFPAALRERLSRENGGCVYVGDDPDNVWWLHPVWDDTDRKRMGRTANHILRETNSIRQWRRFPSDAAAIAENGTGDCLLVHKGDDQIYWFDHETGATEAVEVNWTAP